MGETQEALLPQDPQGSDFTKGIHTVSARGGHDMLGEASWLASPWLLLNFPQMILLRSGVTPGREQNWFWIRCHFVVMVLVVVLMSFRKLERKVIVK